MQFTDFLTAFVLIIFCGFICYMFTALIAEVISLIFGYRINVNIKITKVKKL